MASQKKTSKAAPPTQEVRSFSAQTFSTSVPSEPEPTPEPTPEPAPAATASVKHQRSFNRGLIWLGVGVFLMGASFLLTFFLFQTDHAFSSIMYVSTSAGGVCILKGLADILGF